MPFEGGFQGRTNKLVDGCYSFWLGSIFPIIYTTLNSSCRFILICSLLIEIYKPDLHENDLTVLLDSGDTIQIKEHLFQHEALQEYILICCQHPAGGLLDKPEKWIIILDFLITLTYAFNGEFINFFIDHGIYITHVILLVVSQLLNILQVEIHRQLAVQKICWWGKLNFYIIVWIDKYIKTYINFILLSDTCNFLAENVASVI